GSGAEKGFTCLFDVAESGGETPGANVQPERAHARQGELDLHAALRPDQLVPLVYDDEAEVAHHLGGLLTREEEGEAFRGGDERGRKAPGLACARGGRG